MSAMKQSQAAQVRAAMASTVQKEIRAGGHPGLQLPAVLTLLHAQHDLPRAGRSGHDSSPQAAQVGAAEAARHTMERKG